MASPKATPGATDPASEQPGLELTGCASGGKLSVTQKSELRKSRAACRDTHAAMVAAYQAAGEKILLNMCLHGLVPAELQGPPAELSPFANTCTLDTAPAGIPTASQEVDVQAVRRELLFTGIYTSSDQLVSDLQQRAQAVSLGDTEKLAFLDKRLSAAGIIVPPFSAGLSPRFDPVMPVMEPSSDSPANITGLSSAPTIGAAHEQFYDAAQEKSPSGSPKGSEDGQWELEPDADGTYNSLTEARERLLTEDKLMSRCPPFDLDDLAQLQHAFEECNQRCIRAELNPDNYTGAILSALVQLSVARFQEKTRLQAVHHQVAGLRKAQTSVTFATLRSICEAVSAGEPIRYSRLTMASLSQKQSGSFDSYLSAFETQAAYIQPSLAEKLEVFHRGLLPGLRNKVVLKPDLTEYDTWASFIMACRAYADADLRSREVPVKSISFAPASTSAPVLGKRANTPANPLSNRSQKKLAALASNKPKTAKTSSASRPSGRSQPTPADRARSQAIRKGCDGKLCYWCLQDRHITQRR